MNALHALSLSFVKIYVLTNGILLKDDVIELIIKNRDRVDVQIDLHSLKDEYLKWFTGSSGTINIIQNRIRCFADNNVTMRVATIFTSKNIDEFKDIAKWVASQNVYWGISVVERLGRANVSEQALYLSDEQYGIFNDLVEEAFNDYPGMITIIDHDYHECNCGAMTMHIVIDSYGDIKLCTMDDGSYFNSKMGNCFEKTIKDIFDEKVGVVFGLAKYCLPDASCDECMKCKELYACSRCMLRHFINVKRKGFVCEWYTKNMPSELKTFFFGNND